MAEDNKTEPSTPKKKRDTRIKGEVARSNELNASVTLMSGLIAVGMSAGFFSIQAKLYFIKICMLFPQGLVGEAGVIQLLRECGLKIVLMSLPVWIVMILAGLVSNYLQVGFMIVSKPIMPDLNKINPLNGLQRIFNMQMLVEMFKAVIKISVFVMILWSMFKNRLPVLFQLCNSSLPSSLAEIGNLYWEFAWKAGLLFTGISALDYAWQRFDFERRHRMTKNEVRDEYRESEGDASMKHKRRSRHRKMVQNRMATEVARADVVTINPTHYAVALRYSQNRMRAPKVVAKGERLWAKLIVQIARKHLVPVIQNKEVTRAIYHSVEIGQEIPPNLYRAVAEILAVIYRMRSRKGLKP